MTHLEEADDFYAAGRKLAKHIADSSGLDIPTATLQSLIRDYLPQHEELQEALRSIVARVDFLQLVKLAGSRKGGAQKCAFIESLRKIYSTDTVEAADKLACGLLSVEPPGLANNQNSSKSNNKFLENSDKKLSEMEEARNSSQTEMSVKAGDPMSDSPSSQASQITDNGYKLKNTLGIAEIESKPTKNRQLILGAALLAILGAIIYQKLPDNGTTQRKNIPPNHLTSKSAEVIHLSSTSKEGWYARHTKLPYIVFSLAETEKTARANAEMKCIDRTYWMQRGGGGSGSCELVPFNKGYISVASSSSANTYDMPKVIGYSTGARTKELAQGDALSKCNEAAASNSDDTKQCAITFDYYF